MRRRRPSPASLSVALALSLLANSITAQPPAAPAWFSDAAGESGLDFVHFNGMSGRHYIAEVTGSGGALFDYDGDGDLDLYLVQGRMLGGDRMIEQALFPPPGPLPLLDRLYRNDLTVGQDGRSVLRFVDVTGASGLRADGYGMGVAVGDYDNDGDPDLYLTNMGPNQLWRNNGDGTFGDVTAAAGADDPRWSVPATFVDYDGDGWLDLFVGNYIDFTPAKKKACISETGLDDYCGPQSYRAEPDMLLRNRGDGGFEDVTERAGLLGGETGPALGVVTADFNGDGLPDIYVANDQSPNHLWMNQGDGTFFDDALLLGCAVNRDGEAEASMGVDAADFDGDGDEDLFMAHLSRESNTLYVNDGSGMFHDRSLESGLANPSWRYTSFGTSWFDYDNDGLLDLFTANGAVYVQFELVRENDPYPLHQPNQLFRGLAEGRFEEVTQAAGPVFTLSEVSRGAAFGDVDNDGDTDILLNNNSGPARLLRNEVGSGAGWLGLRLIGGPGGGDRTGSRAGVRAGGRTLWRRARTDGSFASASDPRILVGLAGAGGVERIEIRWSGGGATVLEKGSITGRYLVFRSSSATGGAEP